MDKTHVITSSHFFFFLDTGSPQPKCAALLNPNALNCLFEKLFHQSLLELSFYLLDIVYRASTTYQVGRDTMINKAVLSARQSSECIYGSNKLSWPQDWSLSHKTHVLHSPFPAGKKPSIIGCNLPSLMFQ